MTLKTFLFTGIILVVFAAGSFAQTTDKITPEEYIEANELSHKFADRLFKTKDVRPLIEEYFVKDFVERSRQNNTETLLFLWERDQVPVSRASEYRRFYAAQVNFIVQWLLYAYSTPGFTFDDLGEDPESYLPPPVRKALKKDPYFKTLIKLLDSEDGKSKVMSEKEKEILFDNSLRLVEWSSRILRKSMAHKRPEESKGWIENGTATGEYMNAYKPVKSPCNDDCYNFPKNANLIYVNFPLFQLTLAKIEGKLRVLNLQLFIE